MRTASTARHHQRLLYPTLLVCSYLVGSCLDTSRRDVILSEKTSISVTPEQPTVGALLSAELRTEDGRVLKGAEAWSLIKVYPEGFLEPTSDPDQLAAVAAGRVFLKLTATNLDIEIPVDISCPEASTDVVTHVGTINADEEWSATAGTHRVEGVLEIDGATLTLGACSRLEMAAGAAIIVGATEPARLMVHGSQEQPVVMQGEALDPSGRARWGGLRLYVDNAQDSVITGLSIEDADGLPGLDDATELAAVDFVGSDTSFYSELPILFQRNTIKDCGDVGLRLRSANTTFNAKWTENRITGCGTYPMSVDASSLGALPKRSTSEALFTGNGIDAVKCIGGWTGPSNHYWRNMGIPYEVTGSIIFSPELTDPRVPYLPFYGGIYLYVEAGAIFRFKRDPSNPLGLYLGSAPNQIDPSMPQVVFSIFGSRNHPVVFTSAEPSPNPGDWVGVVVMPNVLMHVGPLIYLSKIQGTIIEYAGAPSSITDADGNPLAGGLVLVDRDDPLNYSADGGFFLDGSLIRHNAGFGIVSPSIQMMTLMFRKPAHYTLTSCMCGNELGPISVALTSPDGTTPEPTVPCSCPWLSNWPEGWQ